MTKKDEQMTDETLYADDPAPATVVRIKKFIRDYDVDNAQVTVSSATDNTLAVVYAPQLPAGLSKFHVGAILAHGANTIVSDIDSMHKRPVAEGATAMSDADVFAAIAADCVAKMVNGTYRTRIGSEGAPAPAGSEERYLYLVANVHKLTGFREENRERILAKIAEAWNDTTISQTGRVQRVGFAKLAKAPQVKALLDAQFAKANDTITALTDLL